MKILLTASVLSHIAQFHKPLINMLKGQGHEVHVAAHNNLAEKDGLSLENVDQLFNIHFHRTPFTPKNIPAYRQLRRVIDKGAYDIIHCNTPAVGVLTRLAARRTRKKHGTKVFYTAHGFHFFKGAPLINWLLYYPTEKFMCRYTDTLITINEEDTRLVQERFHVRHFHMHGVGADSTRFLPVSAEEKQLLRQQLGLRQEDRIILCAGELIPRKNMLTLIQVAEQLAPRVPHLRILIAGNGPMEPKLRARIHELKLGQHVCLLGYRSNLQQYMQAADVVVSCSLQEGLPLNIMEAMMVGKPVVASDTRGHRELLQEGVSGFFVAPTDAEAYAERILRLLNDRVLYGRMSRAAIEDVRPFSIKQISPELHALYGLQATD